ncbi:E3 ubiquitin-protein ligase SP1-like isoform X1 [Actinidia eriantha]|uniref:E3 ubiquitin-protein ligase SP1-like isoform X1 n=1 Tax=Actinidia eriantha TaxID=165200 RepID=UPI0025849797|nr:E3 ubiquitin-protein ligase SP1-like isoform X1 [Actinidia eriantha]
MVPWGGISCCLSAAALYLLGRSTERDARCLKSIARVDQLKELAQLLDAAHKVLPLVVTVSGRVGSDEPIKCEHSGLRGVIVEKTAEQHFLKLNDAGYWIQDSALMLSMCKEVPWYLDDGTGRVYVIGARGATGLALTIGSEVFEEPGSQGGTLDYLQGLKMLEIKRTERVLPTGTPLTVVGEAVKDDVGTIRIQQPHRGPFYVSHENIDQLIANLGKWARCYKYASVGFTLFGVYLLAKHAFQYVMDRRRHWELRKRVLAAAAKRTGQDNEGSDGQAEEESDTTKKDGLMPDLCVICLEQEYNSVFVPCGHMCCCMVCSSHLTNCPLCRRRIEQVVRTFRH